MSVLTRRSLNRATLARQLLLRRAETSVLDVVGHLVGLQGQDPDPPYVGLWNRMSSFRLDDLTESLCQREIVRATLMRGTQHLVTAEDYRWLRPLLQPLLDRWQKGAFGKATAGIDLAELAAVARSALDGTTLTRPELGRVLTERWPGRDPVALARSVQGLLPVVHPPPDGTWGRRGRTPFALADQWLDRPLTDAPSARDLVTRYLAAFGPASVQDVQAWSGLTRLREVVDSLRPGLLVFRSEAGRELFDLPDAPRPEPDVPAPVRFLAALDNVVLAHADRTRMMTDEQRQHVGVEAAVTVDGFVRGLWKITRDGHTASLVVRLFTPLSTVDEEDVVREGLRLLRFAAADAENHDVRFRSVSD
ncbi:winged helix DNA-binding domain-containing protein [Streptoalloteichus hindustanus]|uniref:Winged helix DNA-binding domain-containing protein n=1 Tax=Streptoalloteichus hindustanus TaxID=2017 RepID=A0A1M5F859_STRHI|nr:winged helix DNA-binding domain-containing protein [Streptoalloteichus hindustanus]SHF87261.1 Winged helix DNA-binding domain-containing protein [Streptoalloteichus hindustanus]